MTLLISDPLRAMIFLRQNFLYLQYKFIHAVNSNVIRSRSFAIRDESSRIIVVHRVIRDPRARYRNSIRLQSLSFAYVVSFARCRVAARTRLRTRDESSRRRPLRAHARRTRAQRDRSPTRTHRLRLIYHSNSQ